MKKLSKFIPVNRPLIGKEELLNVKKCLKTGWISSSGKYIKEFELSFANYVNRKYAVAVSSGTGAIDIAVKSLELKKGDEIIVPNFTIISSVNEIIRQGLKPIFIDANVNDFNIDVNLIEKKISKRTKAIMVVHIYGLPSNLDTILKLAKKYKLKIIEDSAEQLGQKYKKKMIGSFGDISTFSFFANKHITTGEGGMLVTNDFNLYKKFLKLRNICFELNKPRFIHFEIGWNYRMTNMQAAIGLAQLKKINFFLKKKRKIGEIYNKHLRELDEITLLPEKNEFAKNIYWVFPILIKKKFNSVSFSKKLSKYNIETRPFFFPMHKQPIVKKLKLINKKEKFPVSEMLYKYGLYLPSGIGNSYKEINYVIKTIKHMLKSQHS